MQVNDDSNFRKLSNTTKIFFDLEIVFVKWNISILTFGLASSYCSMF